MKSGSGDQARYEQGIASAHRAIWRVRRLADEMALYGAASDLLEIEQKLTRMAQDALTGNRRATRFVGQDKLPF